MDENEIYGWMDGWDGRDIARVCHRGVIAEKGSGVGGKKEKKEKGG